MEHHTAFVFPGQGSQYAGVESVQRMVAMGVRSFVGIGPGSVLTGLIKRIDPSVELTSVSDAGTIEAFLAR